jgi:hypothetical protein
MAAARPYPQMGKMVKDSGILLEGIYTDLLAAADIDTAVDVILTALETPAYLGITRGGTSYSLENESRIVEYDGRRVRSVGDFSVDGATPQITTNLLLQSVDNMRRVIPMSDVVTVSGRVELRPRLGSPKPEDYMSDLCWVRDFTDGSLKVEVLFNAINTGTHSQTGADRSESEMSVTFIGTAATFADTEYAPTRIIMWERI